MINSIYTCKTCNNSYPSEISLKRHSIWHNEEYKNKCTSFQSKIKDKNKENYLKNPKLCLTCDKVIEYSKRHTNKFCCKSCSAIYNNEKRIKIKTNCKFCNDPIYTSKNIFCNKECHNNYKKQEKYKEIFNGIGTHKQTKKYLIEKHGNICLNPNCAWDFTKQQVNVELEHINGNSEDNTLENLTLLCPNCHSLTDTYKGKNKGNGRYKRKNRYREGKSY